MKIKVTFLCALALMLFNLKSFSQSYFGLSFGNFTQNWSNTSQITVNNDWMGVPNIIGYRGDNAASSSTPIDPQTVLIDSNMRVVNVTANQTNPNTLTSGGIAEFELTDPVVAFQGSGTADAPFLLFFMSSTNVTNVQFSCNLRDIDGSADNAIQPVAFQYRIGNTGNFTNIPSAAVLDASSGPSLATLVTPISFTLPAICDNQAQLQIRVITGNAVGSDEWIGIDDIVISATASSAPTKLGITSINGGTDPYVNSSFYAVVKSLDASSNPSNVSAPVNYTISLSTGTGLPGGVLSGTIDAGKNVDTLFGITYNMVETGVSLTASDNASVLTAGTSSLFNVIALPPTAVKLALTQINGGVSPYVNSAFSVVVQTQDVSDNPVNVVSSLNFTISLVSGTGSLTGTLTGSIAAGTNSISVSGIQYNTVQNNITIKASDNAAILADGISSPFNVIAIPAPPAIVITEINYNDPSVADSLEYIELYNNGSSAVNLSGFHFTSGINYYLPNVTLTAGNYFVVAKDSNAVQNFYGITGVRKWGAADALNNSGEAIALKDNFGQLVDTVFYDDASPWVTTPDGGGPSLALCDASLNNNLGANWSAAIEFVDSLNHVAVYGTPGSACVPFVDVTPPLVSNAYAVNNTIVKVVFNEAVNNTAELNANYTGIGAFASATRNSLQDTVTITLSTPLSNGVTYNLIIANVQDLALNPMAAPQQFQLMYNSSIAPIVITEIMYNDPSLNDDSLEFVELYNNSLNTANITGYAFTKGITITFPTNTTIPANSFLIIAKNATAVSNFFSLTGVIQWDNGAILSNAGESLEIKNMAGNIIDSLTYKVSSPWPARPDGFGPSLSLCDPNDDNSNGANWSSSTEPVAILNSIMVKATPGSGCTIATFPPTVTDAWATSLTSVKVVFDKPVGISAELIANYTGLGVINTAVRNTGLDTVALALNTPLVPGVPKTLTIADVLDTNGTIMNPAQSFEIVYNNSVYDIVITEIMYNDPSSSVDTLEFIELYNNTGNTANIGGYRFTKGILYTFPANTVMGIGSYLVIAKKASAVSSFFSLTGVLQWKLNSILNNTGEKIQIENSAGNIIDSLTYRAGSPWPTAANGNGPSLTLCDQSADNSIGVNWTASSEPVALLNGIMVYATPGSPCVSTSIGDYEAHNYIVFPNPTLDYIYIKTNGNERYQIKIFDLLGNLINFANGFGDIRLNINDLSKGIYILELKETQTNITKTFKISKL